MMKKLLVLLLSGLVLGCTNTGAPVSAGDLDNDQITGDLILQEADPQLKKRQIGDEKIVIQREIADKQQQLTPDALEQEFDKKNPADNEIQILNRKKQPSSDASEDSSDKFLWFFEREQGRERNADQITPDPLLDEM